MHLGLRDSSIQSRAGYWGQKENGAVPFCPPPDKLKRDFAGITLGQGAPLLPKMPSLSASFLSAKGEG